MFSKFVSWKFVVSCLAVAWMYLSALGSIALSAAFLTAAFALVTGFVYNILVARNFGLPGAPLFGLWGAYLLLWIVGQWFKSITFGKKES